MDRCLINPVRPAIGVLRGMGEVMSLRIFMIFELIKAIRARVAANGKRYRDANEEYLFLLAPIPYKV